MNCAQRVALVDECLEIARGHRLVAMEARMRLMEAKLLVLRNSLNPLEEATQVCILEQKSLPVPSAAGTPRFGDIQ